MKKIFTVLLSTIILTMLVASPAFATVRKTGSQGDYFSLKLADGAFLTFNFADGDVKAEVNLESIQVLFNPNEHASAKATPWKHHDIQQDLDSPTLDFTSGEPYRLRMELFFDTS